AAAGPAPSACEKSLSARCLTGYRLLSIASTRPFWLRKHIDRQDGSGSTGAANMNAAKPCPCRHRGIAIGLVVTSSGCVTYDGARGEGTMGAFGGDGPSRDPPGWWLLLVAAGLSVGLAGAPRRGAAADVTPFAASDLRLSVP